MDEKFKILYLVSGRGNALEKMIMGLKNLGTAFEAEIVGIIADRQCDALNIAKDNNIAWEIVSPSEFKKPSEYEETLLKEVDNMSPDLIICNYDRLLRGRILSQYEFRIINLHYALLPAFPGFRSLDRALEKGVKFCGSTLHFVNESMDGGPIIMQSIVPFSPGVQKKIICEKLEIASAKMQLQSLDWIRRKKLSVEEGIVSSPNAGFSYSVGTMISPALEPKIDAITFKEMSEK
jgi:phosphoribosylglycinamide formyltransferase 1